MQHEHIHSFQCRYSATVRCLYCPQSKERNMHTTAKTTATANKINLLEIVGVTDTDETQHSSLLSIAMFVLLARVRNASTLYCERLKSNRRAKKHTSQYMQCRSLSHSNTVLNGAYTLTHPSTYYTYTQLSENCQQQ